MNFRLSNDFQTLHNRRKTLAELGTTRAWMVDLCGALIPLAALAAGYLIAFHFGG